MGQTAFLLLQTLPQLTLVNPPPGCRDWGEETFLILEPWNQNPPSPRCSSTALQSQVFLSLWAGKGREKAQDEPWEKLAPLSSRRAKGQPPFQS